MVCENLKESDKIEKNKIVENIGKKLKKVNLENKPKIKK